jgi:hypothetical protein
VCLVVIHAENRPRTPATTPPACTSKTEEAVVNFATLALNSPTANRNRALKSFGVISSWLTFTLLFGPTSTIPPF